MVFPLEFLLLFGLCLTIDGINMLPLGPWNISSGLTISGFSSGAFMTVQMHIAHSSIFSGAAAFAGAPYYCAQGNLTKLSTDCSFFTKTGPNLDLLIDYTRQFEEEGKIDSISNINDDQVFVWIGTKDTMVGDTVSIALEDYYKTFIDASHLKLDHSFPAQHTMPTLDWGVECTKLRPPAIGLCNYDAAGDVLQHLLGTLQPPSSSNTSNLFAFDQTPFIPTDNLNHSLGDTGYIYVPTTCQDTTTVCRLHLSLHGCTQTVMRYGDLWADKTGYNRWAESNNIIILYPSVQNSKSNPTNPMGCWDSAGYSGPDYAWQSGVQIRFLRSLITAVSGI